MIDVKFWGTRGSIPVSQDAYSIKQRIEDVLTLAMEKDVKSLEDVDDFVNSLPFSDVMSYGGNTSCVEIGNEGDYLVCDMGSGLRNLGEHFLANPEQQRSKTFHIFMSHIHWDHIMGFPFFDPAYMDDINIKIYGCHDELEVGIRNQHLHPNFPVAFEQLGANIEFNVFKPGEVLEINGFQVEALLQLHEGDSYGYRFTKGGKSIVYSTDSEHKVEDQEDADRFVKFFSEADLVIFDAMYSLVEAVTLKEDWGHSSNLMGVELCLRAGAKKLCLYHHDPAHSDEEISRNLEEAIDFASLISQEGTRELDVIAAWDGLTVKV